MCIRDSYNGTAYRLDAFDNAGIFKWAYDLPSTVRSVSVSSNGDYVTVGYSGGIALLYNGALAWEDNTWSGEDLQPVRISADGKYVIALRYYAHVILYYNQTGTLLWSQLIDQNIWGYDYGVAISFNGQYAAAGGNSTIYFFDKTGLQWSYNTGIQEINSVEISGDGYFIVASSYWGQKLFHLNKFGTLIWEITFENYAGKVAFSFDGEYFATTDTGSSHIYRYFAKKYFSYRFVTPDTEAINNLEVKWYFANGTLCASFLTTGTGWIEFFDPYFLQYTTDVYYWQTKVGSYVLVTTTHYESVQDQVACLFDWNIYICDAGGAPTSARVETYLWNDTLYDNRTADTIRLENMPNQTYTIKVYYQSARATWDLANQSQIALIQEEQNTTITIKVLDYHVKCVNHYNEPLSGINVSIGIDGYPMWMSELTNATGFADFQNILNDTYRVIAYYKEVVVANVTDTVTVQDQVKIVELFLIGDVQPPTLDTPSHKPQQPLSTDTVKVSVNVTDDLSGVHDVILSYRTSASLPWTNVTMVYNSTSLLYEANIPPQPPGTNVTYWITAHDNAGKQTVNDNLGLYFTYRVAQVVLDYHVKCVNHYSEPVPGVNVSLYFTNGTLLMEYTTNATGFVDFLHILSDSYRVIARYKGVVVANVTDTVTTQDQTKVLEIFVMGDAQPPVIDTPSNKPQEPLPTDSVKVSVNVTDDLAGVHDVILSYRTSASLPWTNVTMTYNSTSLLYEGSIPPQPLGTNVAYMITAHDNAGKQIVNNNAGSYFVYTVVPEFPTLTTMLLLLFAVTLFVVLLKRRRNEAFIEQQKSI